MVALWPSWHAVQSQGHFLICKAQWVHFRPFLVSLPSLISSLNRRMGCLKRWKFRLFIYVTETIFVLLFQIYTILVDQKKIKFTLCLVQI